MSNDFAQHLAADRRLVILKVLTDSAGYTTNQYMLHDMVGRLGHRVSLDTLLADLAWLSETAQLITTETVGGVGIATLTQRGLDVAEGLATVPGVKKPRPGV